MMSNGYESNFINPPESGISGPMSASKASHTITRQKLTIIAINLVYLFILPFISSTIAQSPL